MRRAVVEVRPPDDVAQLIIYLSNEFSGNSAGLAVPRT